VLDSFPGLHTKIWAWRLESNATEVYCVPGMQARFQLVHDCILTCIYWKYKLQPASTVQGDWK